MTDRIIVRVQEDRADDERLDELATALRRELMALDLEDVGPLRDGEPPPGARGIELAAVGALLVVFKQSAEVVKGIVGAIRGWLTAAPPGRTVEITVGDSTLKVASATAAQQEQLIAEFVGALQRMGTAASDPVADPPSAATAPSS